jgi:hypothetical protein
MMILVLTLMIFKVQRECVCCLLLGERVVVVGCFVVGAKKKSVPWGGDLNS